MSNYKPTKQLKYFQNLMLGRGVEILKPALLAKARGTGAKLVCWMAELLFSLTGHGGNTRNQYTELLEGASSLHFFTRSTSQGTYLCDVMK